jgi:hypothetical protein
VRQLDGQGSGYWGGACQSGRYGETLALFLSTNKGLLTSLNCKKYHVSGKLLFSTVTAISNLSFLFSIAVKNRKHGI